MTVELLTRAYTAQPFRPFSFRLTDGRTIPVPHPESLAFNTGDHMAIAMDDRDGAGWIDLRPVVSLDFEGEPASSEK